MGQRCGLDAGLYGGIRVERAERQFITSGMPFVLLITFFVIILAAY